MALQKTIKFMGVDVPDAYHRIERLQLESKESVIVTVASYDARRTQPAIQIKSFVAPYDMTAENPFVQGYKYLKNLPEFEGAVDC